MAEKTTTEPTRVQAPVSGQHAPSKLERGLEGFLFKSRWLMAPFYVGLIVSLADKALGRDGRMVRALDAIGPGAMMVDSVPFRIDLE